MSDYVLPSIDTGPANAESTKFRFSLRRMFLFVLVCGLLFSLWPMVVIPSHRRQQDRQCKSQIRKIVTAIRDHQNMCDHMPPAYILDSQGKRLHSWRALLMSYEYASISQVPRLRFDKPWNHSQNSQWARSLVDWQCPTCSHKQPINYTNYVAVVGPQTAFPTTNLPVAVNSRAEKLNYRAPSRFGTITDGPKNTVFVVEIADSNIHWMEPRDLEIETMSFIINDKAKPSISSHHFDGPAVGFGDGEVYRVNPAIPVATLKALLTATGGENINRDDLIRQGYLKR